MLLINCQNLDGLVIVTGREKFDWDILFKSLTKSSPTILFKFKFHFYFDERPSLKSLELFSIIGKVDILCYYKPSN